MSKHDPYAALRNKNYRSAFLTHVLTIGAAQIQATALGWLIYERTHSAAMLGLSGLVIFVPVLCLALPVGFFVDSRWRKSVMTFGISILTVAALVMATIADATVSVGLLFAALALSGIGNALLSISRPAIMRDVIPVHHAENGANWSSLGRRIASVLGPIAAGSLIELHGGASSAFLMAAVLYGLGLLCSLRILLSPYEGPHHSISWKSLTEGIRFIRHSPLVLSATLLDMFAVLLGGAMSLLPIYAEDILHVGATGLGVLRAAPSVGSAIMAFALAHRPPLRRAGMSLLLAVAAYGVATIIFGISASPVLSFFALLFIGVFDAVSVTVRATILQVFVPNNLRGRVYGVNMIFIYSSNELGDFESGMVAALIGTVASVVVGGAGAVLLAVLFGWRWKELRELKKMEVLPQAA